MIGFSKIKRQYANKLGVDVYSSNKVLRKELNSVAWAGFAGGLGVTLATMPISGTAAIVIKGTRLTHKLNQTLLNSTPADLRRINREKLKQIGVKDAVIEEFLNHPKYSPRNETILVHALSDMAKVKNRDQLIKQALYAEYEEEAFIFQRMAEMLYGFNKYVRPIKELIPVRNIVVGYTVGQSVVITLPLDLFLTI